MYTRSPHYLYQTNGIYYFTRQVPSGLKTKFNKNRVVISLRTSSKQKAIESANKLTDRLETYWNTLRLELFHTKFTTPLDYPLNRKRYEVRLFRSIGW